MPSPLIAYISRMLFNPRGAGIVCLTLVAYAVLCYAFRSDPLEARYGKRHTLAEIKALEPVQCLTAMQFELERRVYGKTDQSKMLTNEANALFTISRLESQVRERGYSNLISTELANIKNLSNAYELIGMKTVAHEMREFRPTKNESATDVNRRWHSILDRKTSLDAQLSYLNAHIDDIWRKP